MDTFTYQIHKIYDENKEEIDVARHPRMRVYLLLDRDVPKLSMMRLKVFDKNDYL